MIRISLATCGAVALVAGCGSVSPSIPAGQGDGGATSDAGSGSTSGGSDGGGISGSDGGATGGGVGSADAGGSSGGSGAGDECAGLEPAKVGAPTGSAEIQAPEDLCLTGESNVDGIVPVGTFAGPIPLSHTTYSFFNPDGSRSGGFDDFNVGVTGRSSGFMLTRSRPDRRREVLAVDDHGNVLASSNSTSESYEAMTAHPLGGVIVEVVHPGDASTPPSLAWLDEDVKERWRTQLPNDDQVARIGVDRHGNVLVLTYSASRYGDNAIGAVWIDPSGKPGDAFKAGDLQIFGFLAPRIADGFFLQDFNGNWIAQFEPFAGPTAPPDWLAARPKTNLRMARGARAYAVIAWPTFSGTAASCSTSVEVIAASGKSCGTALFTSDSTPRGNSTSECSSSITVGSDGTAIQHMTSRNLGTCNWRWWSRFFR